MPDTPSDSGTEDVASEDDNNDDHDDHDDHDDETSVDTDTSQSEAGPVAGTRPPVTGGESLEEAQSPPPDSRWWYWVAALPGYFVVATVAGFVVSVLAFVTALTGASAMGTGVGAPLNIGLGVAGVFAVVMLLVGVGMLLTLLFPVAIYLDAEAVAGTAGDWDPDPDLYGLLGLAGIVAQPLQAPLAAYYLYKRHRSEGVP